MSDFLMKITLPVQYVCLWFDITIKRNQDNGQLQSIKMQNIATKIHKSQTFFGRIHRFGQ